MDAAKSSSRPISRPGLNKRLNWKPKVLFPNALDVTGGEDEGMQLPLTTSRELTMLRIMNALTDKSGWEEKVFDEAISTKWKAEATAAEDADVTSKMMDWVIDELRYKVKILKATGAITAFNGDVVKSDNAIPSDLKASLRAAVQNLEDVPVVHKDYHPGSDGQVLDLVHPSLFPLVYGRSRVIEDRLFSLEESLEIIGTGITIPVPPDAEAGQPGYRPPHPTPFSKYHQWLPCEVDISHGQAKITSYINNLHPERYKDTYGIIERIIYRAIPLWNMTLSPLADTGDLWEPFKRINFAQCLEFDPDPEAMDEADKPQQAEGETEDAYYDRLQVWEDDIRQVVLPEPETFQEPTDVVFDPDDPQNPPDFHVNLIRQFADRGLQVIVKLANIELTPEKPEYVGGSWHVEGQLNEHICATALYYYDSENITDSYLAFRQQSSTWEAQDMNYPQSIHGWVRDVYGIDPYGPAVQEVGAVLCKEGRLLTFPNVLQHQVQPFKLADPSRPGHRKILALFLVDPHIKIISTANVPPQQRHWWSEEVDQTFKKTDKALGKLSRELKDKVYEEVDDFPIGMDEAKEIRLRLMDERKSQGHRQNDSFVQHEFSLCEH